MKRLALAVVLLMLAQSASAATRYVAKNSAAAAAAGCPHMSGLTCSSASNCGATFATACCTIQQGVDSSSVVPGDVLEIHAGTYQDTGGTEAAWIAGTRAYAARVTKAITVQNAQGATAENLQCDGGPSNGSSCATDATCGAGFFCKSARYLLDLQGTRSMGFWVSDDNITIDGANCINQKIVTDGNGDLDGNRIGCVTFASISNSGLGLNMSPRANSVLKNSRTVVPSATTDPNPLSGKVGFRIEMKGNSRVTNNTVSGVVGTGFIAMRDGMAAGDVTEIDHNSVTSTRSNATGFILEATDPSTYLYHDNSYISTGGGASRFAFPRDHNSSAYYFNNYASGCGSQDGYGCWYLQDDVANGGGNSENVWVIHNTVENCGTGVEWRTDAYQAHFRNNIFKCTTFVKISTGGDFHTGGVGSPGDLSDVTGNAFSGTLVNNPGSLPVPKGLVVGGPNTASNCALSATGVCVGGPDAGATCTARLNCSTGVCSAHHLTSSSTACIDVGAGSPINTCSGGPTPGVACSHTVDCGVGGTCAGALCTGGSLPGTACRTTADCPGSGASCVSTSGACSVKGVSCLPDVDGDVRPKSVGFDLGMDERAGSGTACGNGVVESGETCDDGNIVTETACAYGIPTCTGCRADCGASLPGLVGHYCGDGTVETANSEACDTAALNGATCINVGCSAGGPPGCSAACQLTVGSCTSCGVPPKNESPFHFDDGDALPTIFYLSSNDGPVGSYLSVFGDDFGASQGTGAVRIGGNDATVVSWADRKIVVLVPSVALGARAVRVTTNVGIQSGGIGYQVNSGRIRHLDMAAAPGGDGSLGAPWNTFQIADAAALPGDHIVVHEGVYVRTPSGAVDTNWNSFTGGTFLNSITWYAKPGDSVIVDGVSVLKTAIRFSAPFVNIVGVVASGSKFQNVYTDGESGNGTDCRIVDSEIKNADGAVSTKGQGINFTGARSEALGNYIHDNYSHGFYVHADDLIMAYNYVAHSGCCGAPTSYGYGIQLYKTVPGPQFFRNQVYRNFVTTSNRSAIVIGDYSQDAKVYENITTGNDERGIIVNRSCNPTTECTGAEATAALPANTTISNNVFYQDGADPAGWYEVELLSGDGATVVNNDVTRALAIAANNSRCSGGPTPGVACQTDAECGSGGTCPGMRGTVRIEYNNYDAATTWKWNATTYATLPLWRAASLKGTADLAVAASHVNAGALDFHLNVGSGLIDSGEAVTCTHAFTGTGCDRSAFEFTPGPAPPSVPNLRAVTLGSGRVQ